MASPPANLAIFPKIIQEMNQVVNINLFFGEIDYFCKNLIINYEKI